jgi:hypothetical protein
VQLAGNQDDWLHGFLLRAFPTCFRNDEPDSGFLTGREIDEWQTVMLDMA